MTLLYFFCSRPVQLNTSSSTYRPNELATTNCVTLPKFYSSPFCICIRLVALSIFAYFCSLSNCKRALLSGFSTSIFHGSALISKVQLVDALWSETLYKRSTLAWLWLYLLSICLISRQSFLWHYQIMSIAASRLPMILFNTGAVFWLYSRVARVLSGWAFIKFILVLSD